MGVCGDSPYDMMEFYQLHDLRAGQLYRAEIDAIDRMANTADITLLDVCASPGSLMDVPFFYHCETSTGTVEDLANGHKAFLVGDWVYAIHIPPVADEEPRFFIIGHVDIRGTRRCLMGEFILIRMGPFSSEWAVIYDTATKSMLDLVAFVSLPGSPAAPTAFPTEMNAGFTNWLDYNFELSTPVADIPHFSIIQTVVKTGESTVLVSMNSNQSSQPSPPGYHHESEQTTWTSHPASFIDRSFGGNYTSFESAYYYDLSCTFSTTTHLIGDHRWRIYDAVIDDYIYVESAIDESFSMSGSSVPKSSPWNGGFDQTISINSSASLTLFSNNAIFDYDFFNKSAQGSQTWEFIYGGASTKNYTGSIAVHPTLYTWENVYCIGEYGFYSIFGGIIDDPDIPITATGHRAFIWEQVHYSNISDPNLFMIYDSIPFAYKTLPMPIVTMFEDTPSFDLTQPVSVKDCIDNNSASQSLGLAAACKVLADKILLTYGDVQARTGPSVIRAYAKKQGE